MGSASEEELREESEVTVTSSSESASEVSESESAVELCEEANSEADVEEDDNLPSHEEEEEEPSQKNIFGEAEKQGLRAPLQTARKPACAHPAFNEWRCEYLSEASLREAFFGCGHTCNNLRNDGAPCHVNLWGDSHTGMIALRRHRVREAPCNKRAQLDRTPNAKKRDHVTTWFAQYAAEVTEDMPDLDVLLLPRMLWRDLYENFRVDMLAAGYPEDDICKIDFFTRTFNTAEELKHMEMTIYKRNFGKCATCIKSTAAVMEAIKGHDARDAPERAKDARLTHYMLARSDKLHYWQQRWQ
ncbi:MAG: hypothetical protein SGPRY_010843, partial [Prymnesium sp.]